MKRSRSDGQESPAPKYAAAAIPEDMRTAFAISYMAVEPLNVSKTDFLANLASRGYVVNKRTFDRWLARVREEGSAVSTSKDSGRPAAVSDEQMRIFVGWILAQNERNVDVHLEDAVNFINDSFGVNVVKATALKYLNQGGFASHAVVAKAGGFKLDANALCEVAREWLERMRNTKFFDIELSDLGSFDFTYTSQRKTRRTSYSAVGGRQPKSSTSISRFTNCIATCVWGDGKLWTPCVLYTHNPKFRLDRNSTKKRDTEEEHLRALLKKYKIDYDRINYMGDGSKKGSKATYVAESSGLVDTFFEKYDFGEGHHIMSDNGSAVAGGFERYSFDRSEFYPASVHQFLSVNDNKLHGEAKSKWRGKIRDFSDDVEATLCLMDELDCVDPQHIKDWFSDNLQLNERYITLEGMRKVIGYDSQIDTDWHKACLYEYRVWKGEDARGGVPAAPPGLESGLDGLKWQ
jgi:hypothetical protein